MRNIRTLMMILIFLFCTGFYNEDVWVIDAASKLSIHGATNINAFTCDLNSYTGHDTLRYFNDYSTFRLQFTTNRMTVPMAGFDCGAAHITKDFHNALKSDRYPALDINFISLNNNVLRDNTVVNGVVDITLAGVKTRYNIQFVIHSKNGTVALSGAQPVRFSDFKLKAPQKLKGLIRVQETLNVEFHLVLKAVDRLP